MAKKIKSDVDEMEAMMPPVSVQKARIKAEHEILAINLGQLREKRGLKQNEIDHLIHTVLPENLFHQYIFVSSQYIPICLISTLNHFLY
ncbi:MAG: hypothetical protein LBE02_07380 [Spirochaetaceae bacterium]|nr:hypothetical protein [Spirochaetaceae bacterium]